VSEDEPALTLRRLQADYPQMTITTGFCCANHDLADAR
jgi:hypothetical protein